MRSKVLVGALALSLIGSLPANAAPKATPVKIAALPVLAEDKFFAGPGGQWVSTLPSKQAIYMVGSAEPAASPTQGEVLAIDPVSGQKIWDFLTPNTTDAIATAATLDSAGNIWIAGNSAPSIPTPTPSPTPTGVLNPSGVVVPPATPTRPDLTLISVWEVSPRGTLLASYQYEAATVLSPLSIKSSKGSFLLSGTNFQITLDALGNFTKFARVSVVPLKAVTTQSFKDGLYIWKSYLSKSPIVGVTGWKPTKPGQVILKVGGRTGKIYEAYKVSDPLLTIDFVAGLGLVTTTETVKGIKLSLLK
jgi:hypothetical protein